VRAASIPQGGSCGRPVPRVARLPPTLPCAFSKCLVLGFVVSSRVRVPVRAASIPQGGSCGRPVPYKVSKSLVLKLVVLG